MLIGIIVVISFLLGFGIMSNYNLIEKELDNIIYNEAIFYDLNMCPYKYFLNQDPPESNSKPEEAVENLQNFNNNFPESNNIELNNCPQTQYPCILVYLKFRRFNSFKCWFRRR